MKVALRALACVLVFSGLSQAQGGHPKRPDAEGSLPVPPSEFDFSCQVNVREASGGLTHQYILKGKVLAMPRITGVTLEHTVSNGVGIIRTDDAVIPSQIRERNTTLDDDFPEVPVDSRMFEYDFETIERHPWVEAVRLNGKVIANIYFDFPPTDLRRRMECGPL